MTLRRRSHEMAGIREIVSGGSGGASAQQGDELRQLRREEQDNLLQEAGLAARAQAGYGPGLALKADLLHLP